jgi:L-asparaginase / beta-aspartyl-peptidase
MPVVLVHGGAWDIPPELCAGAREGCEEAARAGWDVLGEGGTALDAVEAAARALEEDARFNAGRGACLTRAGTIEVDAAVMVGEGLRAGAVACVPNMLHPVTIARRVLEAGEHVLLVGAGATAFAREAGIEPSNPQDLMTPLALERYHRAQSASAAADTIGAVALDARGLLAAATSTGGVAGKRPGRVGDSPLLGAGLYADDVAAASATGVGEPILRGLLCARTVDRIRAGQPAQEAAEAALADLLARTGGRAGVILIDRAGRVGIAHTTGGMSFAWIADGAAPKSGCNCRPAPRR